MGLIIDIIEKETDGKGFKSRKYCNDNVALSNIEYEDNEVTWRDYGETERHKRPIDLKKRADFLRGKSTIFTYFLDGSRHTYKVDDISYNNNVFPIIAGQVGIGCCKRIKKEMRLEQFTRSEIIVLPDIAHRNEWEPNNFFADLLGRINSSNKLKNYFKVQFDAIHTYKRDKEDNKLEKKGVAVIQDYMVEMEKAAVGELAAKEKLSQENFLIKDGSLEYKVVSDKNRDLRNDRVANSFKYVIGVSKSFDPTKCSTKGGGSNSDIIANLKPFERTPAYMYQSRIAGDVFFVIWYLRLRDSKYTLNVFDGVVKVEKLSIGEEEQEKGMDSEIIDNISAHLMNERNPVCYGSDARWANHIYPVYLTESYIKSKYLSNDLFLQLF